MARGEPEFRVRLPVELMKWLKATAASERRSMTQEVAYRLEAARVADQAASRETGATAAGQASQA